MVWTRSSETNTDTCIIQVYFDIQVIPEPKVLLDSIDFMLNEVWMIRVANKNQYFLIIMEVL